LADQPSLDFTRRDFPALKQKRNGRYPVYFDNACTTLVPQPVIDAMNEYYLGFPGCGGGRSRHWFAGEVVDRIEGSQARGIKGSRRAIQEFINAAAPQEIVFTLNASHAINLVALGFNFKPGDVVLLGPTEHNSNLLPWLRLQQQGLIRVEHLAAGPDDALDIGALQKKLKTERVRLVSLAYTSNLTGATLPAEEIIKTAHEHGAQVLLDGAQTVPRQTVDVQALDVDFLAFSIHKMCGPKGLGVLYGKQALLGRARHEADEAADALRPAILGGGTVADSTYTSYELLGPPQRFEVGLQNYPAQIAAGAAVSYLQDIGMARIAAHEERLNRFLTEQLLERYGEGGWFRILGPAEPARRGGILTFEVKMPNSVGIADELNERANIMLRDGVFCVHSYLNDLYGPGWTRPRLPKEQRMTYRISLYFYNTLEECRVLLGTLDEIFRERCYI
jgi:cysteine desulfurase/selenocysteine lyase